MIKKSKLEKLLRIKFHTLCRILEAVFASLTNSNTLLARYFSLKGFYVFLSGCVFTRAFFVWEAKLRGFKSSVKEI